MARTKKATVSQSEPMIMTQQKSCVDRVSNSVTAELIEVSLESIYTHQLEFRCKDDMGNTQ